ncbi:DEAD/DEAH box helicase [Gephyromycinifex aptenodytis]|uniref:DEAD/DEAH box helicase n=1 Tax=Gephyromycinifex aptenodytis TaxID=2716227 RepID=UPI001446F72E|nr:DEAD/DEAH box helicase [Gephyromycinifex aptenodytis]
MASPAQRYAQARRREAARGTQLAAFDEILPFGLDPFQRRACEALEAGSGVLVAAPTGAGKTVVGEFAVHLALATGRKAFYTTPIKALSNQKYNDLVRRHGNANVGLLTGDSSINGEAPVVVMTTEVLRNMMYADSPTLAGLGFVVMDEVHYLADRFRGAVWEEVIIHLPAHVQVASLSATVSNAEEFGAWLGEVRGSTEVIVEEHRPVPLWQHMMVGRDLYDLFVQESDTPKSARAARGREQRGSDVQVNPDLLEAIQAMARTTDRRGRLQDAGAPRGRRGKARRAGAVPAQARGSREQVSAQLPQQGTRRAGLPSRAEVIARLDREGLLPAITFIFSRAGCDGAVSQLITADVRLIPPREGEQIRRHVEERVAALSDQDLAVLGYWEFLEGLTRGFAAHHAGMLPTFREIVEEMFTSGRIAAVFATETLALGINMPARSVVLEKLVKFNGETHADITPAEYTQLTGRAGRRGIDIEGHAVVLWNPRLDPIAVGGLASTRTYPLRSSFRPTYTMAVNLVAQHGRSRARAILETSFAQFQADRAVVGMTRAIREQQEAMRGYAESMTCELGDFTEYAGIRRRITDLEKEAGRARAATQRAAIHASLDELTPGDVVWYAAGRYEGRALVVAAAKGRKGQAAAPALLTDDARLRRVDAADLTGALVPYDRLPVPASFNPRNATARRDLAATLRVKIPDEPPRAAATSGGVAPSAVEHTIDELRRKMKEHPCHRCPDREQHARWAERWWRLERETAGLQRKVDGRTGSIARIFDRVCDLLLEFDYLSAGGEQVTPLGQRLRHLYTERDLLTSECLRHGVWAGLEPAELAAVVTSLIYEPRRDEADPMPALPTLRCEEAHSHMVRLWSRLEDAEHERSLPLTGYPDPGLMKVMYRWASGRSLDAVLRDSELAAGDFVRRCKQIVDLLDQIAVAAEDPGVRSAARTAVDLVMRGVVAADRVD